MEKKVLLIILDGWGLAPEEESAGSAIVQAYTPFMDRIWKEQPHSQLKTYGIAVGLPEGQMGNSEVGHINIGSGRIVYQNLVKINLAVKDGFTEFPILHFLVIFALSSLVLLGGELFKYLKFKKDLF